MEPIRYRKGCTSTYSGKCVKWDGPNIPCLDICTGDSLTDVVAELATKFCTTLDGLDMSTIDLSCLLNTTPLTSAQKTVRKVLELILTNQCDLKDYIDELLAGNTDEEFNINVKCIQTYDEFDQPLIKTRDQLLQRIVNYICTDLPDLLGDINLELSNHEGRIHTLETTDHTLSLPTISTCISTAVPLDEAVVDVASEVCDIKTGLGTLAQIQNAISRQCDGLSAELGNPTTFEQTVNTLAQSINNMWLALCDVRSRVEFIEDNCCASNCASIKLGFSIVIGEDALITIRWRAGDGTIIPSAFSDCGSEVTFTDIDGEFLTYPIEIENNGSTEFDLNGLNLSDKITANVSAKLCREGLTCEKCISKDFFFNAGCPTCLISTDGSGSITVVYQTTTT